MSNFLTKRGISKVVSMISYNEKIIGHLQQQKLKKFTSYKASEKNYQYHLLIYQKSILSIDLRIDNLQKTNEDLRSLL